MASGEIVGMVFEQWDASPDCADCPARNAVAKGILERYPDPADQARASGALGYCATGMEPNPALCSRDCPIGMSAFEKVVDQAVAASHQPKVRAPLIGEEA